ncbi:lysine--tRNA ligase [Candidatus Micrarchaeota archaeon CG08_land_8_20_14_0_20_49_17]|nr:MAG: lysine--tRNA ligase [Candidatus Micrarchaeota archaeon CG1_02_49_24]PIU09570.1 MAG: lysine--tRNA ligase [Candidatus Micrarchaeota archaeon CG08_land_8_20_14_0_20_49_17]PIU81418.1 MAG: lysine--tRNA ligase [Candidatus Micrarchaeota archaeon CG06_land_8_20_14_3_00_50_6]PIZ92189.1 MAG: lysine--tRNA ligase [Candidatus Micrarchaeota archaeon CG_4_10_14_0_2_um_filter_49_7]HII54432.1 lysine--tRNA ligase [Candidatus Micrarchaeota archaeon]
MHNISKHSIEHLADELKFKCSKKISNGNPLIINSGITTSGPAHLGTLCEVLYPHAISRFLKTQKIKSEFLFIADMLDAFDKIPASARGHAAKLTPELGKPLCSVADPFGCCNSYGDHYLNELLGIIERFGVKAKLLKSPVLYIEGRYDEYAKTYIGRFGETKQILQETSGRTLPKSWFPIMPICKCGKIATTRVLSLVIENNEYVYEYVCEDKGEYKGCGCIGKNSLSDHSYKLAWRLDWPSRQHFLNVDVEGAGLDHMTKGGSCDTAREILAKFFNYGIIAYKFGFILLKGKKYSKSLGIGLTLADLTSLLPAEMITYALLRSDLEQNKEIDLTGQSLLQMMREYEASVQFYDRYMAGGSEGLDRSERKKAIALMLASDRHEKIYERFTNALISYQISSGRGGDSTLDSYVESWIGNQLVPEEYDFKVVFAGAKPLVAGYFASLRQNQDAASVHASVYDFATAKGIAPKDLFRDIYLTLIGKEKGPRLGKLIEQIGIEKIKKKYLV